MASWLAGGFPSIYGVLFYLNGLIILQALVIAIKKTMRTMNTSSSNFLSSFQTVSQSNLQNLVLFYWLFSAAAFIILFAPFMATRHVLLALPVVLLILGSRFSYQWTFKPIFVSVIATIFLTVNLGLADWEFADYYRKQAREIVLSLPTNSTIWFTGHWGWQWYAKQSGMKQLNSLTPTAKPGDYLVYPTKIHQQKVNPKLIIKLVRKIDGPSMHYSFLSTANGGASFYEEIEPAWMLDHEPLGSIFIFKVIENKSQ